MRRSWLQDMRKYILTERRVLALNCWYKIELFVASWAFFEPYGHILMHFAYFEWDLHRRHAVFYAKIYIFFRILLQNLMKNSIITLLD